MVSRFPGGSPISHDSSNHVLASFSHNVTKADLVDKVDVIFYDGTDVFAMKSLAEAQGEDENILVVKDPSSNAQIELTIEGNNLIAPITYGLLFDVDYNNQHRKFFEKTSGTYLVKLPLFAAQVSSDPAGWVYPVMYVRNHLDEASVGIDFFVPDDQNLVPMCAKADYSDIDVGEWIADMSASKARELIEKVMRLEYFLPDAVTIDISPNDSQVETIEGDWNLFTDGTEYIPLIMTSRMPGGNPVRFANGQQAQIIASFNRAPQKYELSGKVKAVVIGPGDMPDFCTIGISGDDLVFSGEDGNVFGAEIQGQNLLVNGTEDAGVLYDVDYDKQHQRTLTIPHSGDPLMFEIHGPNILEGPDKLDVFIYSDDFNYVSPIAMPGTNNVAASRGSVPPQEVQMDTQCAQSLIEDICRIEFANYENFYFDSSEYGSEPISGTVDLLTVSTVTPA